MRTIDLKLNELELKHTCKRKNFFTEGHSCGSFTSCQGANSTISIMYISISFCSFRTFYSLIHCNYYDFFIIEFYLLVFLFDSCLVTA